MSILVQNGCTAIKIIDSKIRIRMLICLLEEDNLQSLKCVCVGGGGGGRLSRVGEIEGTALSYGNSRSKTAVTPSEMIKP